MEQQRAAERVEQLRAIEKVLSDPHRLVDAIGGADTYDGAAELVAAQFGITIGTARGILGQQLKLLTRQGTTMVRELIEREQPRKDHTP